MRAMGILVMIVALAAAAVCVRLGVWQLSRLGEKRALNAALRASQQASPRIVAGEPPPEAEVLDRPLQATGNFVETSQFLLSGRFHDGEPGVEVVTPFWPEGATSAILVLRGWLPSEDASTVRLRDYPEPGHRTVRGVVEAMAHGAGGPAPRWIGDAARRVWSIRRLDADSISSRLPYPVAGYLVRESPSPDLPPLPRRSAREPYDEMVHLGYAIQWFVISIIVLGGSAVLVRSRGRRAGAHPTPEASS